MDAVSVLLKFGRRYHKHRVVGLEQFPREGPVLVAVNHSLATYDIFLLFQAIYEHTGRAGAGLGDDLLFKIPGLRRLMAEGGAVPANPDNAEALLRRGRVVMVAPGGMREALRPGDERYGVKWDRRKGFVRLAIRTGTPLVLAACPDADRVFHVYENDLTKLAYKRLHVPIPLVRGWGPTLVPRPVELTHLLSEPLKPPTYDEHRFDDQVDAWHAEVTARMNELMASALRHR